MTVLFESLRLDVVDGVADVQLGDASGSSRMSPSTAPDLLAVAEHIAADPEIRAVLLRARGADFSSGGDIAGFDAMRERGLPQQMHALMDDYHVALAALVSLEVPVVAAVRGAAVGAGLGLACAADVVIVAEDAILAAGASGIGLTGDGGITWYLPRLVGLRRAQEMLLLNRRLNGHEALEWGIATAVAPSESVDDKGLELARRLASGPTFAYGRLRALLVSAYETPLAVQLVRENDGMTAAAGTEDVANAIGAFLRHERPVFQGR